MIAAEVLSALGAEIDPGLVTPLRFSVDAVFVGRESERSEPIPPRAAGAPRANGCARQGPHDPGANAYAPHDLANQPAFLAPLVEDLDSIDATELDARLRRALQFEQRLHSEMAELLLDVARSRKYRWRGFPNLAGYARERLGMSPRKAHGLLRLERAGEICPELRAAFRSGELSWVQAHALGEVQTGAHPTVSGETIHLFFTAPADVARLFKSVLATVQRPDELRFELPLATYGPGERILAIPD